MEAVIFGLVVVGILLAVASAVWVAVALVRAISARRGVTAEQCRVGENSNDD